MPNSALFDSGYVEIPGLWAGGMQSQVTTDEAIRGARIFQIYKRKSESVSDECVWHCYDEIACFTLRWKTRKLV